MTTLLQKIKLKFVRKKINDFISNDDFVGLEKFLMKTNKSNEIDEFAQTPIFRILYNESENQFEMLRIIIKYGANLNFEKEDKTTPIFYAKKRNAEFLIKNGANIFQMSNHNITPLFYCNDISTLEYFLSLGLNINHKDMGGNTPLHNFVYDDEKMVEGAIKNGANVNAENIDKQTPLIYLAMSEYRNEEEQYELIKIAEKLVNNGAIISHTDKFDKNVIDYCIENENFGLENWINKNCR